MLWLARDSLRSLRDSFALHISATRAAQTRRLYLIALDNLISHLEAQELPTAASAVRRERIESFLASRRAEVKPTTQSIEFRALQQFWRWAAEEEEVDRSSMEHIKPPRVPDVPVPVVSPDEFRRLLGTTTAKTFINRRDAAILLLMYDTGVRRGEAIGLKRTDIDLLGRSPGRSLWHCSRQPRRGRHAHGQVLATHEDDPIGVLVEDRPGGRCLDEGDQGSLLGAAGNHDRHAPAIEDRLPVRCAAGQGEVIIPGADRDHLDPRIDGDRNAGQGELQP